MKIVALDLGDRWIGTAISDASCILARPLKTIEKDTLFVFIEHLLQDEKISEIVIGYPKTLRGTESEQTKKIVLEKEELEKKFSSVQWILWDERLTSQHAHKLQKAKNKEDIHSLAAALILDSYLSYKIFQKQMDAD